jgi:hypothetical protein
MHDITPDAVVIGIGIDTHKDVYVAVAINGLGARVATASFPVTREGYYQVAAWATGLGAVGRYRVIRSRPVSCADGDGLACGRGRLG